MTPLVNFLPYVLPYVMGCSEPLALQALRDTAIRFCEQTHIITKTLDPLTSVPGIDTYDLESEPNEQVLMVMQAWFGMRKLQVISGDSLPTIPEMFNRAFPDARIEPGVPTSLMQNPDDTFTLNRIPGEREKAIMTLRASIKPRINATSVDDRLFKEYAFPIGQGAVAYLMKIPNQSFSAPGGFMLYEAAFLDAQRQARIRANKSNGRTNLQVQFRSI